MTSKPKIYRSCNSPLEEQVRRREQLGALRRYLIEWGLAQTPIITLRPTLP